MDKVVAAFPARELHVVLDNLNTHKKNERIASSMAALTTTGQF
jgi:hypothetical protein